jgi:Reverse transcriptase (RNA-dependent DNA polymerase)
MDVGTAYLNAAIEKEVIMRIEAELAAMLVEMYPESYELDEDGCLYVVLQKAQYGCVESAKLWYDEINRTLHSLGFVSNAKDPCAMNLQRNGHQVTVCLYVDNLLVASIDENDIDWIHQQLELNYVTVSINKGHLNDVRLLCRK